MAPGLGQPCFLTSSDPQVATHLRSISGEQATERRSSEGLSNVPGVGGEGHCQRMPPQRPPEVPTPPSGCPALRTQGPGLLPARAQPAGVPEAAEKLVLLLLLVVFRWPRTITWLINLITTTVIERGTRQALCRGVHARARHCLPPSQLLPPPDLRELPRVGPGVGLCTPLCLQ